MQRNLEALLPERARDPAGAAGAMIEAALREWATLTSPGTAP
jgi:hypothetical protein